MQRLADSTVHVFVDASVEPSASFPVGLGGVLLLPESGARFFFSCVMKEESVLQWVTVESKNPIFELECLVILMALEQWCAELQGRNVIVFTDNEGALSSFVRCGSENSKAQLIIDLTCDCEDSNSMSSGMRE